MSLRSKFLNLFKRWSVYTESKRDDENLPNFEFEIEQKVSEIRKNRKRHD